MTKAEIIALAERCEGAEGPDRELDANIYQALHPHMHPIKALPVGRFFNPSRISERIAAQYITSGTALAPYYTASLDAAMTLVPSGFLWTMDSWEGSRWSAGIWRDRRWLVHTSEKRTSKTPALALTSASLRAIAEGMEDEG
jgi:hypothetical protein